MIALNVLLIEDSEIDAALEIRQLEKAGYEVTFQRVETADELQAALTAQSWDIIIADYRLPEFNAPTALSILQSSKLDIPFLVVSGAIGEEVAVGLMKAGACDYLIKGNLARLAPVVERELAEARVRQERRESSEALLNSERNLLNSQRIAHIGHWILHVNTGMVEGSAELFRIFGIEPGGEAVPLGNILQHAIHAEDVTKIRNVFDLTRADVYNQQVECRVIRPNGAVRYVFAMIGDILRTDSGKILQVSGIIQDITERKLIELALLQEMKESRERARELEAITAVSSNMRQAQTRAELIHIILENLTVLLDANFATLAFLEGDAFCFEDAVSDQNAWQKRYIPIRSHLFSQVFATGQPLSIERIYFDQPDIFPGWLLDSLALSQTWVIYPLVGGKNPVGVIVLGANHGDPLLSDQANLLATVAEMAGNAINRMLATEELEGMVKRREMELEHIYQVTSAASTFMDFQEALRKALTLTMSAVHADAAGILLLDPNEHPGWVVIQGPGLEDPNIFEKTFPNEVVDSVIHSNRIVVPSVISVNRHETWPADSLTNDSLAAFPLRIQDRGLGVLAISKAAAQKFSVDELTLLSFIADHLALVVENTRLHKASEESAILDERTRLSRELHDSVTQLLYSASLYVAGAQRYVEQGSVRETGAYLTQIGALTQQALKDMRLMVYELRSAELIHNGLVGTLQNRLDAVERRAGIQIDIQTNGSISLPERMEENLYRIAIEALNNSLKHAQASQLTIKLAQSKDRCLLAVQDNGVGFDPAAAATQGGIGLCSMRERAEGMAGTFKIFSHPGAGARIEVEIPLGGL